MANEDSVLKEVDQELAEERQWSLFREYGPAIIGASAALVIGVGVYQGWTAAQTRAAGEKAEAYVAATDLLAQSPQEGRAELDALATEGGGYAVLAQFRRAAALASDGDRDAAVSAFQSIYEGRDAPKALRNLARVRAAYLSLIDGREAALAHLGALESEGGPFAPYAKEIAGVGALKAEDYESALSIFRTLADDPTTSESLRIRAEEYAALAVSGKAGVNLAGRFELDDIVGAVGDEADPAVGDEAAEDAAAPPVAQDAPSDAEDELAVPETVGDAPENGNEQ